MDDILKIGVLTFMFSVSIFILILMFFFSVHEIDRLPEWFKEWFKEMFRRKKRLSQRQINGLMDLASGFEKENPGFYIYHETNKSPLFSKSWPELDQEERDHYDVVAASNARRFVRYVKEKGAEL